MYAELWIMFALFVIGSGIHDGVLSRGARMGKNPGIGDKGHFHRMALRGFFFTMLATMQFWVESFPEPYLIPKLIFLQASIFWIGFEIIVHVWMMFPNVFRGLVHVGSTAHLDRLIWAFAETFTSNDRSKTTLALANLISYGGKALFLYVSILYFQKTILWTPYL